MSDFYNGQLIVWAYRPAVRGFVAILVLLVLLTVAYPINAQTGQVIRVGVYNFEPLIFMDEDNVPKGVYLDVLEYVAAEEGWQIEYTFCSWAECLARLESGELDLLPSIGYTEERAQKLDYTNEYLFLDWGVVYRQKGGSIETILDLEGKRVAALKGSIYTLGFRTLLEQFDIHSQIVELDEYTQVLAAVERGEVDAGITTKLYGTLLEDNYPQVEPTYIFFSPIKIYYAVPKRTNARLLATLDQYIAALKADKGSVYYQSLNKWLGVRERQVLLPPWWRWGLAVVLALLGFFFVFSMLLRRQMAEKTRTLRESQARLDGIIVSAMDAIISIDAEQKIVLFNPAAERVFRCPANEAIGQPLDRFIPERFRQSHEEYIQAFGRTGVTNRPMHGLTVSGLRADGTEFPIEVSISRAEIAGQEFYTAILRDITTRKQLEAQLLQTQKMEAIGQLAGGIAHDFNNILVPMIGYAELGMMSLPPDSTLYTNLKHIHEAAQRGAALTGQILAFSRKQTLTMEPIDLNEVVAQFEKMLRRLIGENIELQLFLSPKLGLVKADRGQLEQILLNLAVNARDAMPNGGKLTLETANVQLDETYTEKHLEVQPGPYVMLTVSDTGHGMDVETQQRIFEPFFTTKPQGKGTGLGLSTVFGIVKQHGGHIWVYSESGRGTTFKIYLPQAEDALQPVGTPTTEPLSVYGTETVLVVEDEAMVRNLVCETLEAHGYNVLEAQHPDDGLQLASAYENTIHLLLTDVIMPHMNGRELYQKMAAIRPGLKVLFMSGYTDNVIAHHGILDEEVNFLQKPFTVQSLTRKVRQVLR